MKSVEGIRYVMGTFLTIRLQGTDMNDLRQARDIMFNEVQRLEETLSIYRPASEVSQINQAAGDAPVHVGPATYEVIHQALNIAHLSAGAFDPTAQSLEYLPEEKHNYHHVILDALNQTIYLPYRDMRLDLGGIGKGFAIDRALDLVSRMPSLIRVEMDFGGQLLFWTPQGSFDPVTVKIENPSIKGEILSTFEVHSNSSISTSSNAERGGHLLNPFTGASHEGTESVTVIAPTGTVAEGLSTALFILSPSARSMLLEKYPQARAYIFTSTEKVLLK